MKYIVECRRKNEQGDIEAVQFAGFGAGLPNKKIADKVFDREQKSGKWGAVYMEKVQNGCLIDIKTWYKGTKKQ
jgi:hypothetical protein